MKTLYLFSLFLILFFIGKYIGYYNPRNIEINNLKIDTPKNYYIWSAYKDYNNIDISCGYSFGCNKVISMYEVENGLSEDITIIYKSFIPTETLSLSISNLSKVKLDIKELKHIFVQNNIDKKINICLITIEKKTNLRDDTRYHIIYNNGTLISMDIIASNKTVGEKIVSQLCSKKYGD